MTVGILSTSGVIPLWTVCQGAGAESAVLYIAWRDLIGLVCALSCVMYVYVVLVLTATSIHHWWSPVERCGEPVYVEFECMCGHMNMG